MAAIKNQWNPAREMILSKKDTLHKEKWGGGNIYIQRKRERHYLLLQHIFLKLQVNGFCLFPLEGKTKTLRFMSSCLFIIQKLPSYHMVGKFTERQSERKLPA